MSKITKWISVILLVFAASFFTGCSSDHDFNSDPKEESQIYSVRFNTNGGRQSGGSVLAVHSVTKGGFIDAAPVTTREGYVLDGWYTDNITFAYEVTFPYAVTRSVTLYAKWTKEVELDPLLLTGYFIDGPVEGLKYTCTPSGLSGTTDADGQFKYKDGDRVIFNVGSISLPEIKAAAIVYPLSFFPLSEYDDPEVVNLVRFILSAGTVDKYGNIKIDANPFPGYSEEYSGDLFAKLESSGKIKADAEDAIDHFEGSLMAAYSGTYKGTWISKSATNSSTWDGEWEFHVSSDGNIVGSYNGDSSGTITGKIFHSGEVDMTQVGGQDGSVIWSGTVDIVKRTISGTYSSTYDNFTGTFTGEKQD